MIFFPKQQFILNVTLFMNEPFASIQFFFKYLTFLTNKPSSILFETIEKHLPNAAEMFLKSSQVLFLTTHQPCFISITIEIIAYSREKRCNEKLFTIHFELHFRYFRSASKQKVYWKKIWTFFFESSANTFGISFRTSFPHSLVLLQRKSTFCCFS